MFKFAAKKGEKEINYRGRVRKKKEREGEWLLLQNRCASSACF